MDKAQDPAADPGRDVLTQLQTVRDWLRYAVSSMTRAGVVFGHGSDCAVDEAAFLILATLDLPIDDINPWLDCRLTGSERAALQRIIDARITSRKPAAYLTNAAYIQGRRFYVDERVIVPRSFIGELLARDGLAAVIADPSGVRRVLDLCTGSGCLAILAAEAFPAADIVASDISQDALDVARRNIADYGLGERVQAVRADLFDGIPAGPFDLIISNPPYVSAEEVAAFAPEYAAEPRLAHLGGEDGLDLVRRILDQAGERLTEEGHLVVEVGLGQDLLAAARPDLDFLWLDTETSESEVFALPASSLSGRRQAPAAGKGGKRGRPA
jgi:ribosomal protein L3 glutamine methyltransferase